MKMLKGKGPKGLLRLKMIEILLIFSEMRKCCHVISVEKTVYAKNKASRAILQRRARNGY